MRRSKISYDCLSKLNAALENATNMNCETGGLLLGCRGLFGSINVVDATVVDATIDPNPCSDISFTLDGELHAMLAKDMIDNGLEIVGCWHSHVLEESNYFTTTDRKASLELGECIENGMVSLLFSGNVSNITALYITKAGKKRPQNIYFKRKVKNHKKHLELKF